MTKLKVSYVRAEASRQGGGATEWGGGWTPAPEPLGISVTVYVGLESDGDISEYWEDPTKLQRDVTRAIHTKISQNGIDFEIGEK